MRHKKAGKPVGILNPEKSKNKFYLVRYLPCDQLNSYVEHYWIVRWDLRGEEPYTSETLPHPSIHLVFEKSNTSLVGVMEGKFSRLLKEEGKVLGIKFRPGAFYPFVKIPVSRFKNKYNDPADVFNADIKSLENLIFSSDDDERMISIAEDFLLGILPEKDHKAEMANRIVEYIQLHKEIIKVDDMVNKLKVNKRTLQRLFNQYVGVSPKWVIKRYRLHEAAGKLSSGKKHNLAKIALDLGYFDQSHFIKDFKAIIGKTPLEYSEMIT